MNKKRIAIGLLVLAAGWYGFVLCLPALGCGELAFPAAVLSYMGQLSRDNRTHDEVRIAIDNFSWSGGDITYTPVLTREGVDSWVLVARPNKSKQYRSGFLTRLVWLDFRQYDISAYRVSRGMERAEILDGKDSF